jgi:putative transcriptional regulator
MDKQLFADLTQSLKEAAAIRQGILQAGRITVIESPNVKNIRAKTGLSQSEFSQLIGVKIATLQNWEQQRRRPTGAAAALLRIVAKEPELAIKALHA